MREDSFDQALVTLKSNAILPIITAGQCQNSVSTTGLNGITAAYTLCAPSTGSGGSTSNSGSMSSSDGDATVSKSGTGCSSGNCSGQAGSTGTSVVYEINLTATSVLAGT